MCITSAATIAGSCFYCTLIMRKARDARGTLSKGVRKLRLKFSLLSAVNFGVQVVCLRKTGCKTEHFQLCSFYRWEASAHTNSSRKARAKKHQQPEEPQDHKSHHRTSNPTETNHCNNLYTAHRKGCPKVKMVHLKLRTCHSQ